METGGHFNLMRFHVHARDGSEKMKGEKYSMDKRYFYVHTVGLTDKERFALILDYFDKIKILVQEDVECRGERVQATDPDDKMKIGRDLKRMRQSYDFIKEIDRMVEGYKKGGADF